MRFLRELAAVVATSLVLGGLTSPAQMLLPDALRPFANSSSGWTLLTALVIVVAGRSGTAAAAALGATSFVALLIGYQAVSALRGFPDSEELFTVIAVVVGPFVGVAASWLRASGRRAALGVAVLAGIGAGDGANGLLRLVPTTGWVYWTLIGVIALALLAVIAVRRLRAPADRILAIAGTVAVAAAYVGVFSVLS